MATEYWLYQAIRTQDRDWRPDFAYQATMNWAKALRFEIEQEHGSTPREQLAACRAHVSATRRRRDFNVVQVFAPLLQSLNFVIALISLEIRTLTMPWIGPTAVVAWYYAVYNSFRSIAAAYDGREGTNHSFYARFVADLASIFPHPLNMVAEHQRDEEYESRLPSYPGVGGESLVATFRASRRHAQGLLISYLNGTANWYVEDIKTRVRRQHGFRDFRSREARRTRDQQLPRKIAFLHCAFRYRGKANYRDGLFMTYGRDTQCLDDDFISALAASARFVWTWALAYSEQRGGTSNVQRFLRDMREHYRGLASAEPTETFWSEFGR
ncbi:hypothetical protein [Limnochorda pilosa]|uniref:hypothetical protein n=1 Tax=Limnochorda pilosa TaxID=1555112 RepID=UPI0011876662|nr:hypothetical protein [Limnochorda pilosa]